MPITVEEAVLIKDLTLNTGGLNLTSLIPIAKDTAGVFSTVRVPFSEVLALVKSNLNKSDVGLSNVVNVDTSTTQNITDFTNKRFVTDIGLSVISNTSGTNTGDETYTTIIQKIGYTPFDASLIVDYVKKDTQNIVTSQFNLVQYKDNPSALNNQRIKITLQDDGLLVNRVGYFGENNNPNRVLIGIDKITKISDYAGNNKEYAIFSKKENYNFNQYLIQNEDKNITLFSKNFDQKIFKNKAIVGVIRNIDFENINSFNLVQSNATFSIVDKTLQVNSADAETSNDYFIVSPENIGDNTNLVKKYVLNSFEIQIPIFEVTSDAPISGGGIGIGLVSSDNLIGYIVKLDLSDDSTRGRVSVGTLSTGVYTELVSSAINLSYSIGDFLAVSLKKDNKGNLSAKFFNTTTNTFVETNHINVNTGARISSVRLFAYAGTQRIYAINVLDTSPKIKETILVGDSITGGYGGIIVSDSISLYQAGGATTGQILETIEGIINSGASHAIVMLGMNDAGSSISTALFLDNFKKIISALKSANIGVTICHITPSADVTKNGFIQGYNTAINTEYTGQYTIVKTYELLSIGNTTTGILNTIYDSGDGIHPNSLGQRTLLNKIIESQQGKYLSTRTIVGSLKVIDSGELDKTIFSVGDENNTLGSWIIVNAGNPTTRRVLLGKTPTLTTISLDPLGISNFANGLTVGTSLGVTGTTTSTRLSITDTLASAEIASIGAIGTTGRWAFQNAGTTRVQLKGYNGTTENIRIDPAVGYMTLVQIIAGSFTKTGTSLARIVSEPNTATVASLSLTPSALVDVTSAQNGDIWNTGTNIILFQNGVKSSIPFNIFLQNAAVTVANTVTATTLLSAGVAPINTKIIAANFFNRIGKKVNIKGNGIISLVAGTTVLTITITIGGTTVTFTDSITTGTAVVNQPFDLNIETMCTTVGATGVSLSSGTMIYKSATQSALMMSLTNTATVLNTTIANTINLTATFSVANAGNAITLRNCEINIL
jgi:hypothetical protein